MIITNAIDKVHWLKEETQEYFTYKQRIVKRNVNNIIERRKNVEQELTFQYTASLKTTKW